MNRYIKGIMKSSFIQILFSLLYTIMIAMFPYLHKQVFDYNYDYGINGLLSLGAIYIACVIGSFIFQFVSQKYEWKTEMDFNLLIKNDIFKKIINLNYLKFSQKDIGEYISQITNDVPVIMNDYVEAYIDIIKSVMMLTVYGVFLFLFVDYRIALVILIVSCISVFVPRITAKKLTFLRRNELKSKGLHLSKLKDLLAGYALVNEETKGNIFKEYKNALNDSEKKQFQFGAFKTFANVLNGSVMDILSFSALIIVVILLVLDEITIGTGIATLGYVESFIYPIKYILNDITKIHGATDTKNKMITMLEDKHEDRKKLLIKSKIELDDVSYQIGEFKMEHVNLKFEIGKKYLITGASGSGKTTLMKLLKGYISPDSGKILVDNNQFDPKIHYLDVAWIDQHEILFQGDYISNVSIYGTYPICETSPYIDSDTMRTLKITENSNSLSGGEQQLVKLMRAVSKDKKIMIFDEPFSSIDKNRTNHLMTSLLEQKNMTMIFIAHKVDSDTERLFSEVITLSDGVNINMT